MNTSEPAYDDHHEHSCRQYNCAVDRGSKASFPETGDENFGHDAFGRLRNSVRRGRSGSRRWFDGMVAQYGGFAVRHFHVIRRCGYRTQMCDIGHHKLKQQHQPAHGET